MVLSDNLTCPCRSQFFVSHKENNGTVNSGNQTDFFDQKSDSVEVAAFQLSKKETTDEKSPHENKVEAGHDAKGRHADDQSASGFHFQLTKFLPINVNDHRCDDVAKLGVCNDAVGWCRFYNSRLAQQDLCLSIDDDIHRHTRYKENYEKSRQYFCVEQQNFASQNAQSYDVDEFEEKYGQDRTGDDETTR